VQLRQRLTRSFLWISVISWGVLLGGKLFDLRVLVGAWSASPPESLSLLPYGPRWPVDTGEYFFPSSVALLVCSFGALLAGWPTPLRYRVWLAVPPLMMLATLAFTILWFWPQNAALWAIAKGSPTAEQDAAVIRAMVRQWVAYDWLRVAMGFVGLVAAVRAISISFPSRTLQSDDPHRSQRVA
jgi:anthrone oxygenase-like protein